jgi:hypothetical protein
LKDKIDSQDWAVEFEQFNNALEVSPPNNIRNEIFNSVHRDLNPNIWLVFRKLGAIHAVVGSLSLLLCSQFGMGRGDAFMNAFMGYGMTVCMGFCGALFLGLTTLVAGFILSNSEIKKVRSLGYSPIPLLGLASLMIFFCFGANIVFEFAITWLVGATIAGVLMTETYLAFKRWSLENS